MARINSSFRDPSGYLYWDGDTLLREINQIYKGSFTKLMSSGLYDALLREGLIVYHVQIRDDVIKPKIIPFISYPYEWCFSQLKQAALLTLKIESIALEYGMSLKDASAYNVQFVEGKPVFIDTLSFEEYKDGEGWVAYKQFCQHFLAPLQLMVYKDVRLGLLLRDYIDGIPLDLAAKLLPHNLDSGINIHVRLNAKAQNKFSKQGKAKLPKVLLYSILKHLENSVKKLKWNPEGGWTEYRKVMNYNDFSFNHKKQVVRHYLEKIKPGTVWDLGANNGDFTKIAASIAKNVVAFDNDYGCAEINSQNCLSLVMDLSNPSPYIGWANKERDSLIARSPVDCVMALALIHHLIITYEIPLDEIAQFLAVICRNAIVEFVSKDDTQVKKLMVNRKDIYDFDSFEEVFVKYFEIVEKIPVDGTNRVLYLMRVK
ncbi:MAG: hypothetical protein PHQ86_07240 [Dehalococcoidales bacterium]|nr:hypothetical protein [Dehalococcoidales bacterium]